ncbi:hypothetical protein HUG17_2490 [Dermatophagoides farinae]|uniref:RING-type domain-containing protein n=1 Tax=Dermatophagoides farinae TaxID=6954 RepID=A0A9D4NV03_DERFA|nr:E3 ubiquitin-protein ligase Topors-like [Dermatophagoides farinae]KAH7638457.1 hypothetical protein HUG17_2490 [Dermatophagoides farinae]
MGSEPINPNLMAMNIFHDDFPLQLSTITMNKKKKKDCNKEFIRIRTSSSTDNDDDNVQQQCAICLEDIREKTRLLPCSHQFCQYCLFQWINVKLYCPVCRQNVEKLLFKNTTANSYDEVLIKSKSSSSSSTTTTTTTTTRIHDDFKDFLYQTSTMLKIGLKCLYEYFTNHAELKQVSMNNDDNNKLPIINMEDFRRGLYGSCSNRIIWIFFRNMTYQYNLSPYRDNQTICGFTTATNNIFRDVTLNFIREKPAIIARIVEFAKFDLENLQKVLNFQINTFIYSEIKNLLSTYDISSSEFRVNLRSLLQSYCQNSPDFSYKFFIELNNFARSNRTTVIDYVQNTSYIMPKMNKLSSTEIITLTESSSSSSSSSSDSDIQIIGTNSVNKRSRNDHNEDLLLSTPAGPSGLKKNPVLNTNNKFRNSHHCNVKNRIYNKKDIREMRRIIRNAYNSEYFYRKLLLEIKKKFYNFETVLNSRHFQHLTDYFKDVLLSSKLYRSNKLSSTVASKRTLTIDEINQRLKKNSSTTTPTTSSLSRSYSSSDSSSSSNGDNNISDCQIILEQYEYANQTKLNNQIMKHALSPSYSIASHLLMMPQINQIQFENHIYSESD